MEYETAFLQRSVLWALLLIPALWGGFLFVEKRRQHCLRLLGASGQWKPWRSAFVSGLMLFLMIIAVSRPYRGIERIEMPVAGDDIVLLLDVSASMLARDVSPSRLEAAKRKMKDLIALIEQRGHGDRIGIVLFAGEAFVHCPLTQDYAVLLVFADAVSESLVVTGGSLLGAGVQTAVRALKSARVQGGHIILFSDGEDEFLDAASISRSLRVQEIPLDALGFGSVEGAELFGKDGSVLLDSRRRKVVSRLNVKALQELAEASGGRFHSAELGNTDIEALLRGMKGGGFASSAAARKQIVLRYNEFGPLLLLLVLLLPLGAVLRESRAVIFSLMLLLIFEPHAHALDTSVAAGWRAFRAYQAGNFEQALLLYREELSRHPHDMRLQRGLASSLYKVGNFEESRRLFSVVLSGAAGPRERFEAHYNLGNAQALGEDYGAAVKSYELALQLQPDDRAARFNLELARRMLSEVPVDPAKREKQPDESGAARAGESSAPQAANGKPSNEESRSAPEVSRHRERGRRQSVSDDQLKGDRSDGSRTQGDTEEGSSSQFSSEPAGKLQQAEGAALERRDALEWLESLPDAPILLRQHYGRESGESEQYW